MPKVRGWRTEAKVGLFVLAALLLLAYMSLRVGRFSLLTWRGQMPVQVLFPSASGLPVNGRVEVAGVEVGRIAAITLRGEQALVSLQLQPGLALKGDAVARIRTKGMLGEKYIELSLGSPAAPPLPAGGVITQGETGVDFDQLLVKLPVLLEDLRPILGEVRAVTQNLARVLGTEAGEKSLQEMLTNFTQASKSLSQVARNLEQGQGTLGKLLKDDGLYREIQTVVREVQGAARNLTAFAEKLAQGEGTIAKLAQDRQLYDQAQEAVTRLNRIARKIDEAQGTLGKMINDPSLYQDARKALKNVNQAMDGIKEQTPISVLGVVGSTVLR